MYFWSCERAVNIQTYANVSFPFISSKIGSKNKIFLCLNRKSLHSYCRTNTVLRINLKFHAEYVFTNMLIFSFNNVHMHPNVTVQHLKSIPFVQKALKTCIHISVSNKNQSSSQGK